jgi:regulatory protein YycH of two-component signal transduction system YycFG
MKQVSIIGEDISQVLRISVPSSGKKINVLLNFVEQQNGWFLSFQYLNTTINNIRIVTSGNFLHQFRNILPFGMACITEANQEPLLQKDFSSGRSKLYLLTASEVQSYSEVLSGQATA